MKTAISALWRDEEAITSVEYALLLSTIVLASIGAWTNLGQGISDAVTEAAEKIEGAGTSG